MSPRRVTKPSVLAALSPSERSAVLDDLLARAPEARSAAEALAAERLSAVDRDDVAFEVECAVTTISTAELYGRSGRVRGRGYVEPNEAAWELLEEAVGPFVEDCRRRARMGAPEAALEVALGILAGLYSCRDWEDDDEPSVLGCAYAPEATRELADWVVTEWPRRESPYPTR